jgi:hypothetical protein
VLKSPLERKHPRNSHASSTPATDGDTVYVSFLDGREMFIAAYDFQGNKRWHARPGVFSSVHGYCSSPVLFEFLDDAGVATVVRPGPEFESVAVNELEDECFASPAISQGRLVIRSDKALYAIGAAEDK